MQVLPQLREYHEKCMQSARVDLPLHVRMHKKCSTTIQIARKNACKLCNSYTHTQ